MQPPRRRFLVAEVHPTGLSKPAHEASGIDRLINPTASHVHKRSILARLIATPEFGPFVLLVVELVVFWSINHNFLSPLNISNTLAFTVELG